KSALALGLQRIEHIPRLEGAHVYASQHTHEQHSAPKCQGDLAPQRPTLRCLQSLTLHLRTNLVTGRGPVSRALAMRHVVNAVCFIGNLATIDEQGALRPVY